MSVEKKITDDDIMKVLAACHQPITVTELASLLEAPNSRIIRDKLTKFSNEKQIQKFENDTIKSKSYLFPEGKKKTIELDVQFVRKFDDVYQYVGRIDLFNLPKFCGINPYRNNVTSGVQRVRQGAWTRNLAKMLNDGSSVMLTSVSIYLDKTDVITNLSKESSELSSSVKKIIIPYKEYSQDSSKPAWILDGQQRMWAIQRLAIKKVLGDEIKAPIPFYSPITILIGEFKEKKHKWLSLSNWFVAANNTKNLPPNLINELKARMIDLGEDPNKIVNKNKALNMRISNWLNDRETSPFNKMIKSEIHHTNIISGSSMMAIINHNRKTIFNREMVAMDRNQQIYSFIEDYYWAIRVVWGEDWVKPTLTSSKIGPRLLAPIGIGSLAYMIETICPLELRYIEKRKKRVKEIIFRILKLKDEINWQNDVIGYQNTQGDLKRFVREVLYPKYVAMISEKIPEDIIDDYYDKLGDLYKAKIEEGEK